MIAGVILVLALTGPGLPMRHASYAMPSVAACEAAMRAYLAPRPRERGEEPTEFRAAACLAIDAQGRDA